jgi:hypothetical protein
MFLGQEPIMESADMTPRARKVYSAFDFAMNEVLRMYPWPIATKRVSLAKIIEKPAFGFENYFAMPSDLARIVSIEPEYIRYKLESQGMATNEDRVNLIYVSNAISPSILDSSMIEVVSLKLATDLSISILENMNMKDMLFSLFQRALADARNVHAVEDYPQEPIEGAWLKSRYAGAPFYNRG